VNHGTRIKRLLIAGVVFSLLPVSRAFADAQAFDPKLLKNGDLIFQTSRSGQSNAIQLATHSPYSHCGLIYIKSGSIYVFEASTKVKRTPLKRFIKKGLDGKFVIKRLRNADSLLTADNLKKMEGEGKKLEGLPYDSFFGWGDDRIYCSELIYKVYRNALNVSIGKTALLKDFDLSSPVVAAKLKERYGSQIPMEETVISPAAQFEDPSLIQIFSNY
jgi:cell wall-associated NlpC family hydrolase